MIVKGMTEKELFDFCDPQNAHKGNVPWIYWTIELYSHGKYIREYALFPKHLPLIAYGDHGLSGTDIPYKHELETDAPIFLTFSKNKALKYREMTGKQSYVILCPDVYYRRKYKVRQVENHKGTLAFAAHSTPDIDNMGDVDKYAIHLTELPEKYQPVTVCLHMHDINKNQHKIFMKHGLPVVTAGNTSDSGFIKRYYDILKNYSFSTSNTIGSYTLLSIEMGIPFFIYGEREKYINKSDLNITIGELDSYAYTPYFKRLHERLKFDNFDGNIDLTLKASIENELGINDTISRFKLSLILWNSFFKWVLKSKNLKMMVMGLVRLIRKKVNRPRP